MNVYCTLYSTLGQLVAGVHFVRKKFYSIIEFYVWTSDSDRIKNNCKYYKWKIKQINPLINWEGSPYRIHFRIEWCPAGVVYPPSVPRSRIYPAGFFVIGNKFCFVHNNEPEFWLKSDTNNTNIKKWLLFQWWKSYNCLLKILLITKFVTILVHG